MFYSEGTNKWAVPRMPTGMISSTGTVALTCPNGSPCAASSALMTQPEISNDPDHASILNVGGVNYMVVQFEQPAPCAMYALQLAQDSKGALTAVPGSVTPVSWAATEGLWFPCAGITTDWQTHLGSEEYPPDARQFLDVVNNANGVAYPNGYSSYLTAGPSPTPAANMLSAMFDMGIVHHMRYFGAAYYPDQLYALGTPGAVNAINSLFNPYQYGYVTEITVTGTAAGGAVQTSAVKHYSMGRIAFELAVVLPDQKTAYLTDDGTSVGFFKYVATTAQQMSAGTLSCAQMTQTSSSNGGAFNIAWLPMTAAPVSDSQVAAWIAANVQFSNIFNMAQPNNGTCPTGFSSVNQGGSYKSFDVGTNALSLQECLQLNPGNANAAVQAAVLETRRYAGMLGCTTEFTKWEGITYSPARKQLYTAMATVGSGMGPTVSSSGTVNAFDVGGSQDVAVSSNPCGCVYSLNVDSTYTATTMTGMVCGKYGNATTGVVTDGSVPAGGQGCDVNGLSSPDGISYSAAFDTLFIQEDTSAHQNDAMWQYTFPGPPGNAVTGGTLTRMLTGPYGSEVTSTYFQTVGNFSYIKTVVQHPYGESDQMKALDAGAFGQMAATIGYVGPITVPPAATAGPAPVSALPTMPQSAYMPVNGAAAAAPAAAVLAVAGLAMLAAL